MQTHGWLSSCVALMCLGCGSEPAQVLVEPGLQAALPDETAAPEWPQAKLDPVATSLVSRPIHSTALKTLSFHPDGTQLATGDGEGTVRIWDIAKKQVQTTIPAHESWVFDLRFSHDGRLLATAGGDHLVKLWNLPGARDVRLFKAHQDDVHGVAFTPDATGLVSGGDDGAVYYWSVKTGASTLMGEHEKQVTAIAVSPDGELAASASRDGTVRLWTLPAGKAAGELLGHSADVMSIAFSPDGKTLASTSYDKTIRVWDVAGRSLLHNLEGHTDWAFAVAFSPDGKRIATGARDHTLRLWDAKEGKPLAQAEVVSFVASLAFSPDGELLAAATSAGTVELFRMREGKLEGTGTLTAMSRPLESGPERIGRGMANSRKYVQLHLDAMNSKSEDWADSVARLGDAGDGYTLELLSGLDATELTPANAELLMRVRGRIEERAGAEERESLAPHIEARLERAALCDLNCNALEATLVPWALDSIRPHASELDVRQELERIRDKYVPAGAAETQFGSMQERVREYAARLLNAG